MFIKFKIFNRWLLLVRIICLFPVFGALDTKDGTCHKSDVSTNTTFNKGTENRPHNRVQYQKNADTLQNIIYNIISKRESQSNDQADYKITENVFSVSGDDSSFGKEDTGIRATDLNDDTATPVVTVFPTQSSSSSSHFDTSQESRESFESSAQSDLNETVTTFLDQVEGEAVGDEQKLEDATSIEHFSSLDNNTVASILPVDSAQEDMPSFHEWTEKRLAKEEKKGRGDDNVTNVPTNGKSHKKRNKNYASLDCGAKILATNPEAKSAASLLTSSRDEYLLSVCSSKIWFVVELCEAVQLKEIELANFELFSSSPKDFSVLISDRFPSRDWIVIGQFTAKDEKSIQSFSLQYSGPLFTKYIKVEFHSHYGNEHYCPVSLFRVYGTSEFEVLETVDGNEERESESVENDNDVNEPIMSDLDEKKKPETSNRLLGRAKDLVMKIMKEVGALVSSPSPHGNNINATNLTAGENRAKFGAHRLCVTPRYMILCRKCKEEFFHRLYRLMSCYLNNLHQMLQADLVWKPLVKYNVCLAFGITSLYLRDHASALIAFKQIQVNELYVVNLLPREMLAALCNLIAVSENRLKQNVTLDESLLLNQTLKRYDNASVAQSVYNTLYPTLNETREVKPLTSSFKIEESTTAWTQPTEGRTMDSLLRPTKVLTDDSDVFGAVDHSSVVHTIPTYVPTFPDIVENEQTLVAEDIEPPKLIEHPIEIPEESMDSLISELETTGDPQQNALNTVPTATLKPTVQKESVFVRLANRIKALERNMSLSGQYLEELSRRYKKQVEDMQRIVSETAGRETKRAQEINRLAQEINSLVRHINELTVAVDAQVAERESWSYKAIMVGQHSLIIFLEIVIFIGIVCLCRGIPNVELSKRKFSLEWHRSRVGLKTNDSAPVIMKRRQSLDDLNISKPLSSQKRRPSEEALKIDGATHQDLLIYESNRTSKSENRRKKRKRKELLLKSNANAINLETGTQVNMSKKLTLAKSTAPLSRSASASEIDEHSWGRIDYSRRTNEQKENMKRDENEFPSFLKTATSLRRKRLSGQLNGKQILSPVYDVSTDQDSSAPSTPMKEKKINGIKKIVRRFF